MTYRRRSVSSSPSTTNKKLRFSAVAAAVLFVTLTCLAQNQSANDQSSNQPSPNDQAQSNPAQNSAPPNSQPGQATPRSANVTIPPGTRLALVLTQPIETRHLRRGDDVYAQIMSPVSSGNEVVIPPGTFVDGTVDKLQREGGRAELRLQTMSITFPDGYVAPVAGPIILESSEGYALKDPGPRRGVAAFALPAAGAGLGALIGHSVGQASSTQTSAFPPGCIGGPPFCTSVSTPVFGTKAKDAIIGAGIGAGVGAVASVALLFGSHHFFLAAGSPVEMTLQNPVIFNEDEVAKANYEMQQHPVAVQPVIPPPGYYPPYGPIDNGMPPTPPPSNPPLVIPGPPGANGVPGPPIIIPQ
jgi:hypothetical protein